MPIRKVAILLLGVCAIGLALGGCGGVGAEGAPDAVFFGGEENRTGILRETEVTFGGLTAMRLRLEFRETEKYEIVAGGTTCEGLTSAALTRTRCVIQIRLKLYEPRFSSLIAVYDTGGRNPLTSISLSP